MFHKHGSPTNQPKKNLIKRIVGACAMLAVLLPEHIAPLPAPTVKMPVVPGLLTTTMTASATSATALLARKTTKQITAPRTVKTPQAPMSGTMEIISLLFGMGKLSDSIIIVDRSKQFYY